MFWFVYMSLPNSIIRILVHLALLVSTFFPLHFVLSLLESGPKLRHFREDNWQRQTTSPSLGLLLPPTACWMNHFPILNILLCDMTRHCSACLNNFSCLNLCSFFSTLPEHTNDVFKQVVSTPDRVFLFLLCFIIFKGLHNQNCLGLCVRHSWFTKTTICCRFGSSKRTALSSLSGLHFCLSGWLSGCVVLSISLPLPLFTSLARRLLFSPLSLVKSHLQASGF